MIIVVETEEYESVHKDAGYSLIRAFHVENADTCWFENTGRVRFSIYESLEEARKEWSFLPDQFSYTEFRGWYVDGKREFATSIFTENEP